MTGNKYVDAVRDAVKDEGAEVLVIGALSRRILPSWIRTRRNSCSCRI